MLQVDIRNLFARPEPVREGVRQQRVGKRVIAREQVYEQALSILIVLVRYHAVARAVDRPDYDYAYDIVLNRVIPRNAKETHAGVPVRPA